MKHAGISSNAHEDEEKPSFGGSLDHLIASPSPSRRSSRIQKRPFTSNSERATFKETTALLATAQDASQVLHTTGTPEGKVSMPSLASWAIKSEDVEDTLNPVPCEYPSPSTSRNGTPASRKKRKRYDEKQFEGMKGIPDRIAPNLDSASSTTPTIHSYC